MGLLSSQVRCQCTVMRASASSRDTEMMRTFTVLQLVYVNQEEADAHKAIKTRTTLELRLL
jgi:hypothetical protein